MNSHNPPIIIFTGHSGSGKTTFMEKLVRLLVSWDLKVATIKHDIHEFEMDQPGKDSWRHKHAGALVSAISSPSKIGMVMDVDHDHDPNELAQFFPHVDLIIAEGYKHAPYPKLEVFRSEGNPHKKPLSGKDPDLIALISDQVHTLPVPCFRLSDVREVAEFLIQGLGLCDEGSPKARGE